MRISDWSSDVCSSDLNAFAGASRDMFRTLHLNPPHAPAWPAAAPHRTPLPVSRIGARAPLTAQGTDIGAKSGSAAAHDCSEPTSEESRVGNGCVSTCRSSGGPHQYKQTNTQI